MSFFSSDKKVSKKLSSDIPPEFFSAVTVMGDGAANSDMKASSAIPSIAPFSPVADQSASPVSSGTNPFLGESIPEENHQPAPVQGEDIKGSNPFLAETDSTRGMRGLGNAQTSFRGEISFEPIKKRNVRAYVFIGIATVLLALIGTAAVYYKSHPFPWVSDDIISAPVTEIEPQLVKENTSESAPFALDKPNYISINTETATPEDIKKLFDQAASRIVSARMTTPVEFLVTDQNNNPLAFSRFAYIEKFDMETSLLALVEESFSCYVYNDAGQPRMGLVLAFKDPSLAAGIISKKETNLPYAFRTLLYDSEMSVSRVATFRSGTYNAQAVRFVNIDASRNFSFDYALRGKYWFLGASKDTLRTIFDKNQSL